MDYLNDCPVCENKEFLPFLETRDHFLTREPFNIVRCSQCGFLFTQPRPQKEHLPAYYQSEEYISHSNTRKGLFSRVYQSVRQYTLRQKISRIGKYKQTGKLLDIGCGTGEFLNTCQKKGWSVTGVEPSEQARKFATEQYGLSVMTEPELDAVPPSSYDVVTLWHVLEHVPDLNQRMMQLSRILAPEGLLVIAVPNSSSHDASHYGPFWAAYDLPRHLYHFTPSTLRTLLIRHGFQVRKLVPMKFDAYYISLLSEKYRTGKTSYLKAILEGFRSNLSAFRHPEHYSSFIFFCEKQKT